MFLIIFHLFSRCCVWCLRRPKNAQRNGDHCPAAKLKPLAKNAFLEKAAARLARGAKLHEALDHADYKATQAEVITIKSNNSADLTAAKLAQGGFCVQIQNPAVSEAGVYQTANELWVVLAAPFLR